MKSSFTKKDHKYPYFSKVICEFDETIWFSLLIMITDHEIASRITKSYHLIWENTFVDLKLKMPNVQIDLAVNLREVKFYILRTLTKRNFKNNAKFKRLEIQKLKCLKLHAFYKQHFCKQYLAGIIKILC